MRSVKKVRSRLFGRGAKLRALGYAYSASGSTATGGPYAGLIAQSATIRQRCASRGWDLINILDDPPGNQMERSGRAKAFEAVRSGEAGLLIANFAGALADSASELADVIGESLEGSWNLVGCDLGIDTTTESGRSVADYAMKTLSIDSSLDDKPMPPTELIFLATGTNNSDWFDRTGLKALDEFDRALAFKGKRLDDFESILDFGCGSGRILRHLESARLGSHLVGCDIQAPATEWLALNLPKSKIRHVEPLPPLPFGDGEFDLVIAYSVFTHLDQDYQDQWLAELARVLAPGGHALITTQGRPSWKWHTEGPLAGSDDVTNMTNELERRGFLFWRGDGWEKWFPNFYHSAWHFPEYVHKRWSRWFDICRIFEGGAGAHQDLLLLQKGRNS